MQPGDEIITECFYDTASVAAGVVFGLGSEEEMCIAFTYISPAAGVDELVCGYSGPGSGHVTVAIESGAGMAQSWGMAASTSVPIGDDDNDSGDNGEGDDGESDDVVDGGGNADGDASNGSNGADTKDTFDVSDYFVEIFVGVFVVLTVVILAVMCYCCDLKTMQLKKRKRAVSPSPDSTGAGHHHGRHASLVASSRQSVDVLPRRESVYTLEEGEAGILQPAVYREDVHPQPQQQQLGGGAESSMASGPATEAFKARASQRVSATSKAHTATVLASLNEQ